MSFLYLYVFIFLIPHASLFFSFFRSPVGFCSLPLGSPQMTISARLFADVESECVGRGVRGSPRYLGRIDRSLSLSLSLSVCVSLSFHLSFSPFLPAPPPRADTGTVVLLSLLSALLFSVCRPFMPHCRTCAHGAHLQIGNQRKRAPRRHGSTGLGYFKILIPIVP